MGDIQIALWVSWSTFMTHFQLWCVPLCVCVCGVCVCVCAYVSDKANNNKEIPIKFLFKMYIIAQVLLGTVCCLLVLRYADDSSQYYLWLGCYYNMHRYNICDYLSKNPTCSHTN